jgi:YbbR domain-containing protein
MHLFTYFQLPRPAAAMNQICVIGICDQMQQCDTAGVIDITTVSLDNSTFEVSAKLPDVRILDNVDTFTVTIDTTGFAEKSLNVTKVSHSGISDGLSVEGNSIIKNVKIIGPKAMIDKIKVQDITANFDLSNKTGGEHTVTANFTINEFTSVWVVGTYDTTVTIK